jgi:hypothetical protein
MFVRAAAGAFAKAGTVGQNQLPSILTERLLLCECAWTTTQISLDAAVDDQHAGAFLSPMRQMDGQ